MITNYAILAKIQDSINNSSKDEALSKKLKGNLYEFFKHFWTVISPEKFVDAFHIKLICDLLQREGERIKKRHNKVYDGIIINVPPGSTKTTIVLIIFPAWLWAIDPTIRIISASYSIGLSRKAAMSSRDILRSYEYKKLFPHVKIKKDFDTQKEYKTTVGGSRQATSPDSQIIGDHAHIFLKDDLIDPQGVQSATKLPHVTRWVDQTLSQREVDKSITSDITIMQKLGIGDPSEHFINTRKNVFHLKLPSALYVKLSTGEVLKGDVKPPYLKRKYKNGLLDPNRLPLSVIELKRGILTPNDFNAQFQQDTETDTGKIMKKDYFEIVDPQDLPSTFWTDAIMYFFVDSAQTKNRDNDPTGCLIATLFNGTLYLVDYISAYMAFSELIDKLREIFQKHATSESVMFIEPKSNGKDIVDYFQVHTIFNVIEWDMLKGGKSERLNVVEPSVRSRGVKVLRGDWNKRFLRVLFNFPDSSIVHDEEVDVFTMAAAEAYLEGRDFVRNVRNVRF